MSTYTADVNAVVDSNGTWTGLTVGNLTDTSDATFAKKSTTSASNYFTCTVGGLKHAGGTAITVLPTNEYPNNVTPRFRVGTADASGVVTYAINMIDGGVATTNGVGNFGFGGAGIYGDLGIVYYNRPNGGGPWSKATVEALQIKLTDGATTTAKALQASKAYVTLVTVALHRAPTVTAPVDASTVTDTARPIIRWNRTRQTTITVTQKQSTGTSRTLTVASHDAQVGNQITVAISDATFDGTNLPVTAVTATTVTYLAGSSATVALTAATGTLTTGDPGADTWSQVRIFTAAQYGAAGFSPDSTTPTYDSGVLTASGSSTFSHTPTSNLANATTYRVYVRDGGSNGGTYFWGPWSFVTITLSLTQPPAPTISATYDSANLRAVLTIAAFANLLSAQDAQMEADTASTGSWVADTNVTLTNSATLADTGTRSLRLSSVAAGNMVATTAVGTAGYVVLPNVTYSATTRVRAGASARTCSVGIRWYTSAGAVISTTTGTAAANATGAWTTYTVTGAAPANAAFAAVVVTVQATAAAAELHYVDTTALHPGSTPAFSFGGGVYSLSIQRNSGALAPLDIRPPFTMDAAQRATVYDYELPRGIGTTYTVSEVGSYSAGIIASPTATSGSVTATNDGGWVIKAVTNPALNRSSVDVLGDGDDVQEQREEAVGVFRLDGRTDPVVVAGQMWGDDPSLVIQTRGAAEWEGIKALVINHQGTLLIQEPHTDSTGAGIQRYARVIARSWKRSGPAAAPVRTISVQAIEVGDGY